jgi:hypothetical protein
MKARLVLSSFNLFMQNSVFGLELAMFEGDSWNGKKGEGKLSSVCRGEHNI